MNFEEKAAERDELRKLYEDKYFYIVIKNHKKPLQHLVSGPLDNIYYVNRKIRHDKDHFDFVMILNGLPIRYFRKNEILILDRAL